MYWPHSTPVVTDGGEMESRARWRRSLNRSCVIFRLGGIPAAQLCQRAKSLNAKWRLCQNMVLIPWQLSKSPLPSIDQEKEWSTVVYNFVQSDFMRRWCNPIAHPDDVWKQCRFLGRRYLGMRLLISTLLPDPLNTPTRAEILNLMTDEYYSTYLKCCFLLFWSKGVMRGWRGTNVCVKTKGSCKVDATLVNNNTPR